MTMKLKYGFRQLKFTESKKQILINFLELPACGFKRAIITFVLLDGVRVHCWVKTFASIHTARCWIWVDYRRAVITLSPRVERSLFMYRLEFSPLISEISSPSSNMLNVTHKEKAIRCNAHNYSLSHMIRESWIDESGRIRSAKSPFPTQPESFVVDPVSAGAWNGKEMGIDARTIANTRKTSWHKYPAAALQTRMRVSNRIFGAYKGDTRCLSRKTDPRPSGS